MADTGLITLANVVDNNFVVDNNSLFNFLKKEELEGKPLVIISIAGVSRSGKSFIMNFFLRYLREKGYMAGTNNTKAMNEAFAAYKERLRELCRSNVFSADPEEQAVKECHERALKLAVIQFRYMASMGDEESKVQYLTRLKQKCEEEFRVHWGGIKYYQNKDDSSETTVLSNFAKTYKKIDSTLKLYPGAERNSNPISSGRRGPHSLSNEDADGDADLSLDDLFINFSHRDLSLTKTVPSWFP